MMTRPHRQVADAVRARSVELGVPMSDVISSILAESFGMPQHAPQMPKQAHEEELPMTG